MYDGTKTAFRESIGAVAKACYDAHQLFDDINEFIEEDWFYGDYEDEKWRKVNEAHDIAYKSMQELIDIKWRAAHLQSLLSDVLDEDLRDKQWVIE